MFQTHTSCSKWQAWFVPSNFLSGSNWSEMEGKAKMRTVHFHKLWTSHFHFKRPFSFRPSGRPFSKPFTYHKASIFTALPQQILSEIWFRIFKIYLFQQKSRKSDRNWKSCLLSWIHGCTSDLHSDDNIHIFKCNCDRNWSNYCWKEIQLFSPAMTLLRRHHNLIVTSLWRHYVL